MQNAEQIEYWNGEAGERWAIDDDRMARLLLPISEALLEHAPLQGCLSGLDIGCGGGSQSLMLAKQLGEEAHVLGVDISAPMLAVARNKLRTLGPGHASLDFLQADASTYAFDEDSFDLLFSRFGVMFFDDPIGAFSNMRDALSPNGKLAFVCWQGVKHNAWTRIPLAAALQHLPPPEPMAPDAPGPFAFADPVRVESILEEADFESISIEPYTTAMRVPGPEGLGQAAGELTRIGPVARLLQDQPPEILQRVLPTIEEALQPHYRDGELVLEASVWLVTATID